MKVITKATFITKGGKVEAGKAIDASKLGIKNKEQVEALVKADRLTLLPEEEKPEKEEAK